MNQEVLFTYDILLTGLNVLLNTPGFVVALRRLGGSEMAEEL